MIKRTQWFPLEEKEVTNGLPEGVMIDTHRIMMAMCIERSDYLTFEQKIQQFELIKSGGCDHLFPKE